MADYINPDGSLTHEGVLSAVKAYTGIGTLADLDDEEDSRWLVPGLVFRGRNMLHGRSYAGKSTLTSAMIHTALTGSPFLGVAPDYTVPSVLVVCSDRGEASQYSKRAKALGTPQDKILFVSANGYTPLDVWDSMAEAVALADTGLIIVDNARGMLSGDVDESSRAPWVELWDNRIARLEDMTGAATVLIHHASEHGGKRKAMDNSSASNQVRHEINISYIGEVPDNRRVITTVSNVDAGVEIKALIDFDTYQLNVTNVATRQRSKEKLDRNAEMAKAVIALPAGHTQKEIHQAVTDDKDLWSRLGEESRSPEAVKALLNRNPLVEWDKVRKRYVSTK